MFTLINVTEEKYKRNFCLTDCGPSEGCNPDDDYTYDDTNDDEANWSTTSDNKLTGHASFEKVSLFKWSIYDWN